MIIDKILNYFRSKQRPLRLLKKYNNINVIMLHNLHEFQFTNPEWYQECLEIYQCKKYNLRLSPEALCIYTRCPMTTNMMIEAMGIKEDIWYRNLCGKSTGLEEL